MTSQVEKILEAKEDIEKLPQSLIDARLGIIGELELFEDAFANLCAGVAASADVPALALANAEIRANCLGANSGDILKFNLGSPSDYSGVTSFTYPSLTGGTGSKPKFGVLIRDKDLNYTISLSTDPESTVISTEADGTSNTYSNYIGDYYFVRSRETGKLIDLMANTTPYVNPGVDMPFGTVVTFGEDVSGEVGNWNEKFAYANIGDVEFNGTLDQFVTLSHTLEQGSEAVAVSPPKIGDYFGLKRFTHDFETFTITANTTLDLVTNITGNTISTSDASKLVMGSELSSTAWSSNLTVVAIDTDLNVVVLDDNVDNVYTNLEITSKQIMPTREENTMFAIAQIVPEGMVPDSSWKPIGDDDGNYGGTNESFEDMTVMDKSAFETALSVFNPPTAKSSSLDLFKSASTELVSSSSEIGQDTGNYSGNVLNPLFPAVQGARDNYDSSDNGLQPTGLGMKDVFVGRFVKYEEKRKDTTGALIGDYRYMIDFASKFFYLVSPFVGAHNYTPTVTGLPNTLTGRGTEPQATFTPQLQPAMTSLAGSLNGVGGTTTVTSTTGHAENKDAGQTGTIPDRDGWMGKDYNDNNYAAGSALSWGTPYTPANVVTTNATTTDADSIDMFAKSSSNLIELHSFRAGSSSVNATHTSHGTSYTITEASCMYNNVQNIVLGNSSSNDFVYVQGKINTLNGLASYRDPLLEVEGGGEYDEAKKTAAETFNTAITACKGEFNDLDNYHDTDYDGIAYSKTDVEALADELDACNADISTRLTELNSRIGNPTYSGSQSSGGDIDAPISEPGIRVSDLPAKASGTLVPYGRTIYEAVNVALGDDIGLITEVVAEADSLQFKYKEVRDKRNEHDMLKGRSKYYGN